MQPHPRLPLPGGKNESVSDTNSFLPLPMHPLPPPPPKPANAPGTNELVSDTNSPPPPQPAAAPGPNELVSDTLFFFPRRSGRQGVGGVGGWRSLRRPRYPKPACQTRRVMIAPGKSRRLNSRRCHLHRFPIRNRDFV